MKYLYGTAPVAGIVNSSSIVKIASGLPIDQPSANFGAAGRSLSSPFGAPPSTHATMVSISLSRQPRIVLERRRAPGRRPTAASRRATTRCLIDLAHGRAASNVVSDIGANIVGRWHSTQLLLKIGATSFGERRRGGAGPGGVEGPAANATAGTASSRVKMSFLMEPILPYGRVVGYLIPSCSR